MKKRWSRWLMLSVMPVVLHAASYDWNLNANGSWNSPANWLPNTGFPNGIDDVANFGPVTTAVRFVSLGQPITIGTINFDNPYGYSIGSPLTFQVSSGSAAITYNNTSGNGSYNMTAPTLVLNSDLVITKNVTTSLISYSINVISGPGGITLNGTGGGTLRLTGGSGNQPNTYTGLTTINGCTLALNKVTRALSGDVLINPGGTLETNITAGTSAAYTNITLDGGTLRLNSSTGANIFTFNSGTTTGAGSLVCANARLKAVTMGCGLTLTSASGGLECIDTSGSVLISGPLNFSTTGVPLNVPRLSEPVDLKLTGVITGSGYTLTNTGIVEIGGSSPNNTTGTVTVLNGTLLLNKTGGDAHFGPLKINGGTAIWLQPNQVNNGIANASTITLTSGTMDMGSFSDPFSGFIYQGGTFLNPPLTLTLTSGTAPLTMRNTTINTNIAFTSTGFSAVIAYDNTNDGQATINGDLNLGTRSRIFSIAARPVPTNTSMSLNGAISGTSGMSVTGGGVLELTGSTDNTVVGTISLTGASTVLLNKSSGARALPGLTVSNGTARCLQPNQFLTTGAVTLGSSTSLFDLNGFDQTIGSLTFNSGTLSQGGATLTLTSSSTALTMRNRTISGPISLTGGGAITFNTALGGTATISGPVNLGGNVTTIDIPTGGSPTGMVISGIISNGGIVKTGDGGLSLTGANTYSGGTKVSGGNLFLTGSVMSDVLVDTNGFMYGSGFITGNVSVKGKVKPSQTIGTLSVTGNYVQEDGSILEIGFNPTFADTVDVVGSATIGASTTLMLQANPGDYSSWPQYIVMNTTGGVSGTFSSVVMSAPSLTGTVTYDPNQIQLAVTGGVISLAEGHSVIAGNFHGNSATFSPWVTNHTILTFDQVDDGVYAGRIDGPGDLVKQGGGRLNITEPLSQSHTFVEEGTLAVNSTFRSDLYVSGGAVLQGSGEIIGNLFNRGTLAPGNSIGTINVIGDYAQITGSTLEIEISPSASDLVAITGNATIQTGATLLVQPERGVYPNTRTVSVLTTGGTLTGTYSTLLINLPTFSASLTYPGAAVSLTLNTLPLASVVTSGNANAVALCIDQASSSMEQVVADLRTLSIGELVDALNQMSPALLKGMIVSQQNNNILTRRIVSRHLEELYQTKQIGCLNVWGDVTGDFQRQHFSQGQTGYFANTGVLTLGVDGGCSHVAGGFSATYSGTSLGWRNQSGTGTDNSLYATLYLSGFGDHFFVNAVAMGSYNMYKETRKIIFDDLSREASNNHNGYSGLAHLDLGPVFGDKSTQFRLIGGADYLYMRENGFNETGAAEINLQISSANYSMVRTELGAAIAHCFVAEKSRWIPDLKGSWIWEKRFNGGRYRASFADQSCTFTTSGFYPNRSLFEGGVGLTGIMAEDRAILSLRYAIQVGGQLIDQTGMVQLIWKF